MPYPHTSWTHTEDALTSIRKRFYPYLIPPPLDCWLEAGPGHGEYLLEAAQKTHFSFYYGIEISKTSADMCQELLDAHKDDFSGKKVAVEQKNFFDLKNQIFDAVVIGEVLEHVENPASFLEKIREITTEKSFIYVATVANCPQKDHIYLFHSVAEIESLYRKNGFEIVDSISVPTNGYTLEKALKQKAAINTAHILRRI